MESGILCEDERVELIRGEIVEMAPIGERHAAYVRRLNPLFAEKLSQRVLVDIQNPIKAWFLARCSAFVLLGSDVFAF